MPDTSHAPAGNTAELIICSMKIDSLTDQGSGSTNEDQILAAQPVFAVFDGVTSLKQLNDVIVENRRRMNIDYGALNGEPGFVRFVETGTCELENIAHIVLATDGLFVPTENPEDEGWDQFAALYLAGGLKRIQDFVREREESDPKCWRYPRFKVHDDIGAIAISF